jgi:5-formyltetrahydrofolate cyclo-ligase
VTEVRDDNGPSYYQGHVHGIVQLVIREADLDTLYDVVIYTVVAAQNHGCHEPKQLFCALVERPFLIGASIQIEEPLDAQVSIGTQNSVIHFFAVSLEFVQSAKRSVLVCFHLGIIEVNQAQTMTAKTELRKRALATRMSIPDEIFREWSKAICARLLELDQLKKAICVHAFWPIHAKREVDIRPVIRSLHNDGKTVYLPISHENELSHGRFTGEQDLKPGPYGVLEPQISTDFNLQAVDLVLIPALAVDLHGNRLGYGMGYYDRFLTQTDALKVVPIFANQVVDGIPAELHDVRTDIVITERAVFSTTDM